MVHVNVYLFFLKKYIINLLLLLFGFEIHILNHYFIYNSNTPLNG